MSLAAKCCSVCSPQSLGQLGCRVGSDQQGQIRLGGREVLFFWLIFPVLASHKSSRSTMAASPRRRVWLGWGWQAPIASPGKSAGSLRTTRTPCGSGRWKRPSLPDRPRCGMSECVTRSHTARARRSCSLLSSGGSVSWRDSEAFDISNDVHNPLVALRYVVSHGHTLPVLAWLEPQPEMWLLSPAVMQDIQVRRFATRTAGSGNPLRPQGNVSPAANPQMP
jgi:hypothetical protein